MPTCCPISSAWSTGTGRRATPQWRGTDGPLHITRGPRKNPLFQAFIEAGAAAGYGATDDYNGHRQEGFGAFDMTVWQGRRWSAAADAYLRPRWPGRCTLRGLVERIEIDDGRPQGCA
jgi:choline dehydrogenase